MTEVVILPGLDGTTVLLEEFCSSFTALGVSARAVAYPPDLPLGYSELELLGRAHLPQSGRFVLLGESFSGPLAIQIAANPPPGLVGLVLSTTFARAPVPVLSPLAPLLRFIPCQPPMSLLSWLLLGSWATPQLKAKLASTLRSVSPAALRARAGAALRVDVSGLLRSVRLPVLQLVASQDRLLAKSVSESLGAGLPSCKILTLAGPHLLLQTATQPCARAVAVFALGLVPNNSFKPTAGI